MSLGWCIKCGGTEGFSCICAVKASKAEAECGVWKARAEKAERRAKAYSQFPDEQKERLARRAIANLRRARKAEKQHAADAAKDAVLIYQAEKRAERAEALLREASKEGYLYHAGYCQYVDLKPRPCNCGFEAWQKKVLEGKHDAG